MQKQKKKKIINGTVASKRSNASVQLKFTNSAWTIITPSGEDSERGGGGGGGGGGNRRLYYNRLKYSRQFKMRSFLETL